jgi:hypothetical protein
VTSGAFLRIVVGIAVGVNTRRKKTARGAVFLTRGLQLTLKVLQLAWHTVPFSGIGRRIFNLGDVRPDLRQLGIQFQEYGLVVRQFIFREDGANRALRFTQRTVDTLVRVDHQKIGAFVKAINRANFHTVCVLTFDAIFPNYKSHRRLPQLTKFDSQQAVQGACENKSAHSKQPDPVWVGFLQLKSVEKRLKRTAKSDC